ncbi:MAG TPA: ATP-dependent helicase HrpB [Myxococcaceae bacterium]|nr:ATP-dependent helicase HrpB [Myxococcaceae bacterium]
MAQKAQQAEAASAAQKAQGAASIEKARMDPSRLMQIKANRVDQPKAVQQQSLAQKVGMQKGGVTNDIRTLQQTVGSEGPKGQNIAVKMMGDIEKGQGVMDRLISEGLSGRQFQNSELLALQAGMYKYTQELELTGKVVEKATSGLKDTLKTQV